MVLAATDGKVDPDLVPLDTQCFYIRVRRIPPLFLTPAIGEKIGNFLGTYITIDRGLNRTI